MDAFFRVWAAKESFCKFRGTGIDGSFSQFSVTDGERLLAQADGVSLTHFLTREGYAACLASQEEARIVIRYLWAREIEAKNLRVVLVSVANGVEKDAIREVLRHVR